jgi:GxxExxY protein
MGMEISNVKYLSDVIRQTSFELHSYLKHGHLEKVYENGLMNRLSIVGLSVKTQFPIKVFDEDGTELGNYYADLLVENSIIIEIKACRALTEEHTAQILGYIKATGYEHGILVNFGAPRLQVKKYILN